MIVVRNVFQLEFGKAKEAVALWKTGAAEARKATSGRWEMRLLTDVTGPAYTLVVETTHESLAAFEKDTRELMADSAWRAWYPRFIPLARGSHREIYTVEE